MTEEHRTHIAPAVAGAREGETQPVEVELLPSGAYRILYSPGLVEGIAAGDTIRVVAMRAGVSRSYSVGVISR
ncbi:MAG: hypothetical protein H0W08_15805 [Acidobacteria bacterium]|nr:hypothetical protein [Acidobacteriota bacterium]